MKAVTVQGVRFLWIAALVVAGIFPGSRAIAQRSMAQRPARIYYLSPSGDDSGEATKTHPWKTIGRLNQIHLGAGDAVYFQGGQVFQGSIILDSTEAGEKGRPILINSYGTPPAIIQSGNGSALSMHGCRYIIVRGLDLQGSGRKGGEHAERSAY